MKERKLTTISPSDAQRQQIYTVDALLEMTCTKTNARQWSDRKSDQISVQGRVSKIWENDYNAYVDLKGCNFTLKLKCPLQHNLNVGDRITATGVQYLKPSYQKNGMEVIIDVHHIECSQHEVALPNASYSLQKKRYLKLAVFLENCALNEILLIGSETGIRDVFSEIDPHCSAQIHDKRIAVSNKKIVLETIQQIGDENTHVYKGLLIVRGGDDDSLFVWDDPEVVNALLTLEIPFYVALGHSHFSSLTCMYADESFNTPNNLGAAISSAIKILRMADSQNNTIDALRRRLSEAESTIKDLNDSLTANSAAKIDDSIHDLSVEKNIKVATERTSHIEKTQETSREDKDIEALRRRAQNDDKEIKELRSRLSEQARINQSNQQGRLYKYMFVLAIIWIVEDKTHVIRTIIKFLN